MKHTYDVIVVLGYRFDNNWILPDYLIKGLQRSVAFYYDQIAPKIAVCGKWNLGYDYDKIIPPVTEAEKMRSLLVSMGVPNDVILKEEESKDTIGNAYFLKKRIVEPNQMKRILVICADFHLTRARYIFDKVFGKNYVCEFESIETNVPESIFKKQEGIYEIQRKFLSSMSDGDDSYLQSRLYSDPYYGQR